MPYRSRPPGASSRSKTVTACPARVSCWAAASPAGPEPITATVRPVRTAGGIGTTHPDANARSMISTSTCLIVTGSALIPSTQAASHGAGQSRPVNSGKLLVAQPVRGIAPVVPPDQVVPLGDQVPQDRKSTRLNSSHLVISYAVFCLKKKNSLL